MDQREPLSFEAFRAVLADVLHIDPSKVTPEAYLITDLGVDSLRMLKLLLTLEEMGIAFRLEVAPRIQTVGEAYAYYLQELGRSDKG